jgi:DNA-binding transcriptional MerR regulator/DNA-binding HxlR family transcriptional regulator
VRIGVVAERTGVSPRMIRYHEQHGHLPSREHSAGRHRSFDEKDVRWLRSLQTLLAAGVLTPTAVRALRGELSDAERAAIDRQLDRLSGNVWEVRQQLEPAEGAEQLPAEERMSLAFDSFLMRTRMESYLSAGLREAGMVAGDYALVSLLAAEGQLTPAVLARLVGVAPSTLGPRLNGLTERGWVERQANPASSRSWLLQLTPAGWAAYDAAVPFAKAAFTRLDRALQDRRVDLVTLRQQIKILSTTLRSLLPNP